jgi:alpha-L-fucosidase 2
MGQFYEDFLTEDNKGRLVTIPSASPEICPVGRNWEGCLSSMSTFDIELTRELFSNLIEASTILDCDEYKRSKWQSILEKLPHPTLNKEGRLLEWLDDEYEVTDPGHRHRSHLVSFCPGDRITAEDTPEYNEGVRKALAKRHSYGRNMSCSIDKAWDAQILARLYEGGKALDLLNSAILVNTIDNLLMSICDWRDRPGSLRWFGEQKVFQIEASLGTLGAITEMIVQDRRGLLRLLPALPPQWSDGHITGVNCRGGFTMDIVWKNSKLVEASITSHIGNVCRIKCFTDQEIVVYTLKDKVETSNENGIIKFNTIKGRTYLVLPSKAETPARLSGLLKIAKRCDSN